VIVADDHVVTGTHKAGQHPGGRCPFFEIARSWTQRMNPILPAAWKRIRREEDGSELVEFTLVIIPLFMFVFAVISVAWLIFAQACLQNGAREAVRFAITHKSVSDIEDRLRTYAFGFADGAEIHVQYFAPNNLQLPTTNNDPGNLVEVSVKVACPILIPFGSISPTVTLSADSSDLMEGQMVGGS
jgi:hypothetical protein